jgi:hypothetical protein
VVAAAEALAADVLGCSCWYLRFISAAMTDWLMLQCTEGSAVSKIW